MTERPDSEKMLRQLASLCARSEQCTYDLRLKMHRKGLTPDEIARNMQYLIDNRFVDDERYARSLATDKVRFAGWGRRKIAAHLIAKKIPSAVIREAMEAIDPQDYKEALIRAARAKARALDLNVRDDRNKMLRHLVSRGFEPALAIKIIEAIVKRISS